MLPPRQANDDEDGSAELRRTNSTDRIHFGVDHLVGAMLFCTILAQRDKASSAEDERNVVICTTVFRRVARSLLKDVCLYVLVDPVRKREGWNHRERCHCVSVTVWAGGYPFKFDGVAL
jgi:hypothetical protein